MSKRIFLIDILRFVAILLMVIFHLAFDLNAFKLINVDFMSTFWFWLPRFIVFLFLLCVGMSLRVVHFPEFKPNKFWPRFAKLLFAALLVSASTYIMFPKQWVYLGTLHCIALTTLMALPFIRHPKVSLIFSILILISMYPTGINFTNVGKFFNSNSMDFIPPYPWFSIVLLGIFCKTLPIENFDMPEGKIKSFIKWCSEKSLIIYLLHQPIMFGSISLIYKFLR